MKITDVALWKLTGEYTSPPFSEGNRQSQSTDVYPESNARTWAARPKGPVPVTEIYVEVQTDEGTSGLFGPIDGYQADIIRRFLAPYLIGRDPLATELLYDHMLRMNRHGRSGIFMTGVSVVDCALWDLKGKAWDKPIYRLLGGPTRPEVPAYASMLGYAIDPEAAAEVAVDFKAQGFTAQKWFFRYGPGDGTAGKEKNLALVKALRESVGPFYPLMFDAFMGWDLRYASEMARAFEPYNVTWLEEPLHPERVGAFSRLKAASNGITELVKICALASAFETPVIAHGHSLLAALHVAGSQSPNTVPYVEYLFRHQSRKQHFHSPTYAPVNGSVKLPDLPGLGLVLDDAKILSRERI